MNGGGATDILSVTKLYDLIELLACADQSRIAMYGASRGAMMTYICLRKVSWIRTAIIASGPTDLDNSLEYRPEMKAIFKKAFNNTEEGRQARSAIKWIKQIPRHTPLLLMHATYDDRVDPRDSIKMAEALYSNNYEFSLHMFNSRSHILDDVREERDYIIYKWLQKYL